MLLHFTPETHPGILHAFCDNVRKELLQRVTRRAEKSADIFRGTLGKC
jgi:hypothetical protein